MYGHIAKDIKRDKGDNPFRTKEGLSDLEEIQGNVEDFLKRNKQMEFKFDEGYEEFLDLVIKKVGEGRNLSEKEEVRLAGYLGDKIWRICSGAIYKVKNKNGEVVPFIPTKEQYHLLTNYHHYNVILKARQLGFTTLIAIILLDDAIFKDHQTVGIIAHKSEAAYDILDKKIRDVYLLIPSIFRVSTAGGIEVDGKDNSSTIEFSNGSKITASTSFRSGTLTHLHVSELGKIANKDPIRAEEIFTGAFPAVVSVGYKFIESTAEGQSGRFFDVVQQARDLERSGKRLNEKEPKFFFYSWWENKNYTLDDDEIELSEETILYALQLEEKYGLKIVVDEDLEKRYKEEKDEKKKAKYILLNQLKWYQAEERVQGIYMKREYPSHPDEAFEATLLGAYFKEELVKVRKDGRIRKVEYSANLPLYITLDIGYNDPMSVIFFQVTEDFDIRSGLGQVNILRWYHVVQYDLQRLVETLIEPVLKHNTWKVPIWFVPHDSKKASQVDSVKGSSYIKSMGYKVKVLKKANHKSHLIGLGKRIFRFCHFDKDGIMGKNRRGEPIDLVTLLGNYVEEISRDTGLGTGKPVKGGDAIHAGDAWCYLGQACTLLDAREEPNQAEHNFDYINDSIGSMLKETEGPMRSIMGTPQNKNPFNF